MARTQRKIAYNNFMGGMNVNTAPDNLADNEMQSIINMDIVHRGSVIVRNGTVKVPAEALMHEALQVGGAPITAFCEFARKDGKLMQLLVAGGNLYNRDAVEPLLTGIGQAFDYTVYASKLYFLANDKYYVWDGLTAAPAEVTSSQGNNSLDTVKKCKFIEARQDRIFMAGNPDAPNALYFSQVGDPTYFKTGDYTINAASGDGDRITGLKEFNDALLVFKARGVWAYTGNITALDVRFNKLSVHCGTRHFRTIQNVDNYLFFLGDDGVYLIQGTWQGTVLTKNISLLVGNLFKSIKFDDSKPWLNAASAVYYDGRYYLTYPCGATERNNRLLVCHVESGSDGKLLPWTKYEGFDVAQFHVSADGKMYFARSDAPAICVFDEAAYDDNGEPFNFFCETKGYDVGSPVDVKKFRRGWVWLDQDNIHDSVFDLKLKIDYQEDRYRDIDSGEALVWGEDEWGEHNWGWIDTVTRAVKTSTKGIRIGFTMAGRSKTAAAPKNRPFLYGVGFMYKPKKPYKQGIIRPERKE